MRLYVDPLRAPEGASDSGPRLRERLGPKAPANRDRGCDSVPAPESASDSGPRLRERLGPKAPANRDRGCDSVPAPKAPANRDRGCDSVPARVDAARGLLKAFGWLDAATAAALLGLFAAGRSLLGPGLEDLAGSFFIGAGGLLAGVGLALFGALEFAAARGVAARLAWARPAGIVFAVLWLFFLPVGTVLGAIVLKGLLGREASAWFAGSGPARPL